MRNVTVVLDDETALWARIEAAKQDTSVSKYVGEMLLRERMREGGYEAARISFMSRGARVLREPGERYPTRDELHER